MEALRTTELCGDPPRADDITGIPFRCPRCDARFIAKPGSPAGRWRCAEGHTFESTRRLIAVLLDHGWRADIEVRSHDRSSRRN